MDVQARGYYPSYAVKRLKKRGIWPEMEPEDLDVLKSAPVDFISFSYYNSRCIVPQPPYFLISPMGQSKCEMVTNGLIRYFLHSLNTSS